MKTIYASKLLEQGACPNQVAVFRAEFGDSARITLKNCRRAVELRLDPSWAAAAFFSAPAREAFIEGMASARKAYKEAIVPAWKDFNEAIARKAYTEATAPMWKDFIEEMERVRKAYKAYKEARAPARKDFIEAMARAFYEAAKLSKNKGRK